MNETIEKCHRLVKTTMYKASPNTPLAKLREKIKETIRDKRLALPLFHLSEKVWFFKNLKAYGAFFIKSTLGTLGKITSMAYALRLKNYIPFDVA